MTNKLTKEKLADIRAKAKVATPGEWEVRYADELFAVCSPGQESPWILDHLGHPGGEAKDKADAEHIASADPETVLALLDELANKDALIVSYKAQVDRQYSTIASQDAALEAKDSEAGAWEQATDKWFHRWMAVTDKLELHEDELAQREAWAASQAKTIADQAAEIREYEDNRVEVCEMFGEIDKLEAQLGDQAAEIERLITAAGAVIQEARHHNMHPVINLHMARKLEELEAASTVEAES